MIRTPSCALALAVASAIALAVACGPSTEAEPAPPPDAGADSAPEGPKGFGAGDAATASDTTLTGTVLAPNGTLPIAGALVYVASAAPGPIPDGAYCDACIDLSRASYAVTGADGTFTLRGAPAGERTLVVQKGQFRRVRKVTIAKDAVTPLSPELTSLPARRDDAAGDMVPRVAIFRGAYDAVDVSLKKLGLAADAVTIFTDKAKLHEAGALDGFHIVFIPCHEASEPEHMSAPEVLANLNDYVKKGGKLYVSDWSYEYVRGAFAGFVQWEGESDVLGTAAQGDRYDAPATAVEPGLGKWLTAIGHPTFSTVGNFSKIAALNAAGAPNEKGEDVVVTPSVWVENKVAEGDVRPATVSFQYGCGRALYSTYHTENVDGSRLLAQEKALLHVILEVSVCVGVRPDGPR